MVKPEPEPCCSVVDGSQRELELRIKAVCDYAKFSYSPENIVFKETMLYQTSVRQSVLTTHRKSSTTKKKNPNRASHPQPVSVCVFCPQAQDNQPGSRQGRIRVAGDHGVGSAWHRYRCQPRRYQFLSVITLGVEIPRLTTSPYEVRYLYIFYSYIKNSLHFLHPGVIKYVK